MAQAEIHPNGLAGQSGEHRLSAGLLLPEEESAPPRRTLDGAWGLPCEPAVRPCGKHSPGPHLTRRLACRMRGCLVKDCVSE
jgi:hypothetical protein